MSIHLATAATRRHIRELDALEVHLWLSCLGIRWGVNFDPDRWPEADTTLPAGAVRLNLQAIPRELVRELLTEIGAVRAIELSVAVVGGYEVNLADADFGHDSLGGVWTDAEMTWLVYNAPWPAVTLAGEELVAQLRERESARATALPDGAWHNTRRRRQTNDLFNPSLPVAVQPASAGREALLAEATRVLEAMTNEELRVAVRELRVLMARRD